MAHLKPVFAQAVERNEWSCDRVTNTAGTISLCQQEVLFSDMHPEVSSLVRQALEMSGDGWLETSVEMGFFIAAVPEGRLPFTTATSFDSGTIFVKDLNKAFDRLLRQCGPQPVERLQFYHTHPRGPFCMQVSRSDVDQAIRLKERAKARFGLNVPFDMHAMPYDIAYAGDYIQHRAPALGSKVRPEPLRIPVIPRALRVTLD